MGIFNEFLSRVISDCVNGGSGSPIYAGGKMADRKLDEKVSLKMGDNNEWHEILWRDLDDNKSTVAQMFYGTMSDAIDHADNLSPQLRPLSVEPKPDYKPPAEPVCVCGCPESSHQYSPPMWSSDDGLPTFEACWGKGFKGHRDHSDDYHVPNCTCGGFEPAEAATEPAEPSQEEEQAANQATYESLVERRCPKCRAGADMLSYRLNNTTECQNCGYRSDDLSFAQIKKDDNQ